MADSDVLIEEQTKTDESLDVPWNVVAHNDPINLLDYVAKVFMRVFGHSRNHLALGLGEAFGTVATTEQFPVEL